MPKNQIILHSQQGLGDQFVINGLVHSFFIPRYEKIYIAVAPLDKNETTLRTLYKDYPMVDFINVDDSVYMGHQYVYDTAVNMNCEIFKLGWLWMWDYANPPLRKFPGDPSRYIKYNNGKNSVFCNNKDYRWNNSEFRYPIELYNLLDVPYSHRYTHNRYPKVDKDLYNKIKPKGKYIVVHNKSRWCLNYDLRIESPYEQIVISEGITDNLFNWLPLILEAEELHCACSAVYNMVDNIATNGLKPKLFYHKIKQHTDILVNTEHNKNIWNMVYYSDEVIKSYPVEKFYDCVDYNYKNN
jgi:hypothetical protein